MLSASCLLLPSEEGIGLAVSEYRVASEERQWVSYHLWYFCQKPHSSDRHWDGESFLSSSIGGDCRKRMWRYPKSRIRRAVFFLHRTLTWWLSDKVQISLAGVSQLPCTGNTDMKHRNHMLSRSEMRTRNYFLILFSFFFLKKKISLQASKMQCLALSQWWIKFLLLRCVEVIWATYGGDIFILYTRYAKDLPLERTQLLLIY